MKDIKHPVNFRDIGGLEGADGRHVINGRIFRGGQLFDLSDTEKLEFCNTYGIRTIIDLRNEESFRPEPNGAIPGVDEYHFEVMMDMDELSKSNPMRNSSAAAAERYLTTVYAEFVTNSHAKKCFRDIIELFASQDDGGLYFHCYAGKDRTGVVASILLSILGVGWEDILADYMRTAEGRRSENERLVAEARKEGKSEDEIGAMSVFLNVKTQYLENTFRKAKEIYGSFEGYIRDGIGINSETIASIRTRYLRT